MIAAVGHRVRNVKDDVWRKKLGHESIAVRVPMGGDRFDVVMRETMYVIRVVSRAQNESLDTINVGA